MAVLALAPMISLACFSVLSRFVGVDLFEDSARWIGAWIWLAMISALGTGLVLASQRKERRSPAPRTLLIATSLVGAINVLLGLAIAVWPYMIRGLY
jgi:cytochrome bd-type quinol oxidase subunit 2